MIEADELNREEENGDVEEEDGEFMMEEGDEVPKDEELKLGND